MSKLKVKPIKTRNPEKVLMNVYTRPQTFKSKRNDLNDGDALKQIKDYMRGDKI